MSSFLQGQMDYLFFFSGLAFFGLRQASRPRAVFILDHFPPEVHPCDSLAHFPYRVQP
jgi:hypothetical protein